jgi:hypothetical protein
VRMDKRSSSANRWARVKALAGLSVIAFGVTLALVIGNRLSDEALAVLAGAACGVGAAIPTSLLIVAITQRTHKQAPGDRPNAYPPVVVVTPPGSGQQTSAWNDLPASMIPPMERNFTVVGDAPMDTGSPGYTNLR